jgi:hypothetical protein
MNPKEFLRQDMIFTKTQSTVHVKIRSKEERKYFNKGHKVLKNSQILKTTKSKNQPN